MPWYVYALSGPVLWAASIHFDKYLVERFFKHTDAGILLIFTALMGVLCLPAIAVARPDILALPSPSIAIVIVSGFIFMTAMYFYLRALQQEEASVVAPFFQASAVFGYGLGYLVLGEVLSARQLWGAVAIVAGALLITWRFRGPRAPFKARLAALMLACSLALAICALIFKVAALRDDFWTTTFWLFVGQALFGLGALALPGPRRQFLLALRENTGAIIAINGANELINLGGALGNRYALTLAPLSLVQAIGSTTTLFVFLFGVALTLVSPALGREDLSRWSLVQKGGAALLVALGILLMNS